MATSNTYRKIRDRIEIERKRRERVAANWRGSRAIGDVAARLEMNMRLSKGEDRVSVPRRLAQELLEIAEQAETTERNHERPA